MNRIEEGGYLTIARIDGDPADLREMYERTTDVMSQVGEDHGLILHAATITDEGLMMVNLWPSVEESEAAAKDPRRIEALRSSGVRPEYTSREHYEVMSCYGAR